MVLCTIVFLSPNLFVVNSSTLQTIWIKSSKKNEQNGHFHATSVHSIVIANL